jgi:GTPase
MKSGYVSLIGRPNAGKSTLLNTMVGAKVAIVSDKPQTTRGRILGVKNYPDGQIVFVDTPGIHRPLHRLNVRMVDAAVETLREVDVVALIFDASTKPGHGDEFVAALLEKVRNPVVLVLNKIDLVQKAKLLPLMEWVQKWREFAAIVPVSAQTGDGVDRLERVLLEQLPEGDSLYPEDYLTDKFDEEERERMLRLYCTIFVEHDSQKAIVIGRGGEMIKRIGTEARKDLEETFETRIFLDLRVKVNPDWRNDDRALDDLGVPRTARKPKRR